MSKSEVPFPKMHRIWLYFLDSDLERKFRVAYEEEIRGPLRFGMVISILAWLSGLGLVYYVIPEKAPVLVPLIVGLICPFFLFIIYATYKQRFKGWIHIIGAISNAWAGLLAIYACGEFPNGESFTLPVLIFILFFGSYMVRLRWVATVIVSFLYTIGFQLYMMFFSELSAESIASYAFIMWLTWIFAGLAGHVSELKDRIRFIQRKTITEQQGVIEKEKEASEKLLLNILPPFVAQRLKSGETTIADKHNDASILFADMVGFTQFSANMTAEDLIQVLNHVFSEFDALTEKYELEKIKTIGDGYMVAGGLTKNRENHLSRMLKLAMEMSHYIEQDEQLKKIGVKVRIGVHSGPVVAGVIGTRKFSYDLWGDTVNTGSRMETHGEVGKICVSEVVKLRMDKLFEFEKREVIDIKGKGITQTYFLTGVKDF